MLTEHETQIRVRYSETDRMGFVYHPQYFTYFEIGRTELLRASGGNYREMEEAGLLVVVVKAQCRYRRPACYDDLLTVRTVISRVSAVKIEHQYTILRGEERLVEAELTLAIVDREGRVQPVPDWWTRP